MEQSSSYATLYGTVYGSMNASSFFSSKQGMELSWAGLTVVAKNGKVKLLADVCGSVKGRLLAVMGPSGSGKTTFLNQLSLRGQGVVQEGGKVTIDQTEYSADDIRILSGYVLQDDVLFEQLTVYEVLMFAAEMRMHPASKPADKKRRVNKLLKLMDLTACKDVIVGSPMVKGISGGQRKRLCVAVELITRPSILFLDEPTSGLDSVNAMALVEVLRGLAHKDHVTVVTTIHQPSTRIFAMFDDVLILDKGCVVYHGPSNDLVDYYARAGYPCPIRMNPAEWALEALADPVARDKIVSMPQEEGELLPEGSKEAQSPAFNQEKELERILWDEVVLSDLERGNVDGEEDRKKKDVTKHAPTRISWFKMLWLLFVRSSRLTLRGYFVLFAQLLQTILMAFLIGGVFYQTPMSVANVTFIRSALFFCTINQGIFGALMTINIFPAERLVIMRERLAGMYPAGAYFLAKCAAELIFQCIYPILFSVITYFMCGFRLSAGGFFIFLGFMELTLFAANSVAFFLSALLGNVIFSAAVLPFALEIARLFGGFFLPPSNLPIYFVWLDSVSYVKYTYMALVMNQFQGQNITCVPGNATVCTTGDAVLASLGIDYMPIYACALVLIGLILVLRVLTYVVLKIRP